MADITVSSDVDTMLKSANNAEILSNIGAGSPESPVFTGTTTAPKIVTNEIQSEGSLTTGSDSQPIKYDAKEHRFRDFDAQPTNLMVISKFNGYTGARIGINKEPSSNNAVALHVVAGKNASTNVVDTALKVIGHSHFDDTVRLGGYNDDQRNALGDQPIGTLIYNNQHSELQVYIGAPDEGWRALSMQAVST